MKTQTSVFFLLIIFVSIQFISSTIIPHFKAKKGEALPRYKLQLNDPPIQRWVVIASEYKDQIKKVIDGLDDLKLPSNFYDMITSFSRVYNDQEFVEEIQGIANAADLPFPKIFFLNLLYELTNIIKSCTSLVYRDKNGTVIHARNMDFFFWDTLSKLMVQVDVYRGLDYICSLDNYAGSVITVTGIKPGKFAITVNSRHYSTRWDIMSDLLVKQYVPSSYLSRKVLQEQDSYADAVRILNTTNVAAPIYYTVSGLQGNEGCVIEKAPENTHGFYPLTDKDWFQVITNYDKDKRDPLFDRRRVPTEKLLRKLGNNISKEEIFKIMTEWPRFNIATLLTFVGIPSQNYHNATAWYGVEHY